MSIGTAILKTNSPNASPVASLSMLVRASNQPIRISRKTGATLMRTEDKGRSFPEMIVRGLWIHHLSRVVFPAKCFGEQFLRGSWRRASMVFASHMQKDMKTLVETKKAWLHFQIRRPYGRKCHRRYSCAVR